MASSFHIPHHSTWHIIPHPSPFHITHHSKWPIIPHDSSFHIMAGSLWNCLGIISAATHAMKLAARQLACPTDRRRYFCGCVSMTWGGSIPPCYWLCSIPWGPPWTLSTPYCRVMYVRGVMWWSHGYFNDESPHNSWLYEWIRRSSLLRLQGCPRHDWGAPVMIIETLVPHMFFLVSTKKNIWEPFPYRCRDSCKQWMTHSNLSSQATWQAIEK